MDGSYITVVELELVHSMVQQIYVAYTNDCQLQYCTPDDGYSRYLKSVEIWK
jgi:hypothetical protein